MLVSQGTMQPRAICALADFSLNMLSDAVVRMKEYYAALAQSLKDRNSTSFWKDVEKMASSKIPLAIKVGGVIGDEQISEMWHHHSLDLLNSVHNTDSKSFVSEHINDTLSKTAISISVSDVRCILKEKYRQIRRT